MQAVVSYDAAVFYFIGMMRTITALKRQERNKERVNVYLDGQFAFGLNSIDAAQFRKGQQLSDSDIKLLTEKDTVVKAVDSAVRLLARRPRSTNEIRISLARKGIPDTVIAAAVERLIELRYLDDQAFARFWVENRIAFKPRGARALQFELRQKGISDTIIAEVLNEMHDESEAAYQAARSRASRLRGLTQYDFQRKLGGFLERRGFQYESIRRANERVIEELKRDNPSFFIGVKDSE